VLLRFRVANVRSFRDEQELSFVVRQSRDASAAQVLELAGGSYQVHTVAAVFGANASGKSNLLAALFQMRSAVLDSYVLWRSRGTIPRDPFKLDPKGSTDSSFFETDLEIAGVRYTYGFELGDRRVESEWLHAYPKGVRQVWFDRDAGRDPVFEFPGRNLGPPAQTADLARRTRSDALFLTLATLENHAKLSPLFDWFKDNLWLASPEEDRADRETYTITQLGDERGERVAELLRVADLGISGARVVQGKDGAPGVELLHTGADEDTALDWSAESYGTRSWFALLGPVLLALDTGALIMIDELDASLHPSFAAEIIRLFQNPDTNTARAQLLFTTHDATLLGARGTSRMLDPDQVWLTAKDARGATELYPLAAAEPGEAEDLESSYLLGRFGAVPRVTEGQIGRRLHAAKTRGAARPDRGRR
jgi:AAA15 family ATPase/GTPase